MVGVSIYCLQVLRSTGVHGTLILCNIGLEMKLIDAAIAALRERLHLTLFGFDVAVDYAGECLQMTSHEAPSCHCSVSF